MKKYLSILLVIAMLFAFAACGGTPDDTPDSGKPDNSQTDDVTEGGEEKTDPLTDPADDITAENWGVSDYGSAVADTTELFFINYPHYRGYTEGYGHLADQLDGTLIYVAGQGPDGPEISDQSEVFPAYFSDIQFTLECLYGLLSDNYEFTLKSTDKETIGDYEMDIFVCEVTFEDDGTPMRFPFISYATTLKSNGAHAFWVVFDISEDQSNGDLIAEHARNMAKTFREEE